MLEFDQAIDVLNKYVEKDLTAGGYDGMIVKKLAGTNTLDEGKSGKQTHIAITGAQMDLFPALMAENYHITDDDEQTDADLKKYFVLKVPVILQQENVQNLAGEAQVDGFRFDEEGEQQVQTCLIKSKRAKQGSQLQISLINADSPEFIRFRRLIHEHDYIVFLKRRKAFIYECYGIKGLEQDTDYSGLDELNSRFFKQRTSTSIDISDLMNGYLQVKGGKNILLYGVPGCGKSHTIKEKYCSDEDKTERVVFHPDYTYSDFTGQIMPRAEGGSLRYVFVPGPFTRILKKAANDDKNMYYLIIEELNRGNAPAIFGEIFQLLDRDEDGKSIYGVANYEVAEFVYGESEEQVKLPSNLTILATMNTADQNVFAMDTAFQRRWDMRMIENDVEHAVHANTKILDSNITWKEFNQKINQIVTEDSSSRSVTEDKRLGAYFIGERELVYEAGVKPGSAEAYEQNKRFAEKVIKYLWDDVFRYNKEKVFREEYHRLEDVIHDFAGNRRFKVFCISFEEESVS